jgi:glutamate/tyrosine decarboxylase-like PLP-dependent enzyme
MATFTALAAARQRLLAGLGWDVERRGLRGAPPITIVTGEERHVTVDVAMRYLGIGSDDRVLVPCDAQGAIESAALAEALERVGGPAVVVAQAGNVNTGAFDPFDTIADACEAHGAWLHVDGAFGLWARLDPERRHLLTGVERADSWGTDGHKWLNVPYDTGMVFLRDETAHRTTMRKTAAYAMSGGAGERDGELYVPEFSRRARAIPVYAALRSLGRRGVAELIARDNRLARRFAAAVSAHPRIDVLNDVVINQVLLRFRSPAGGDPEALLDAVVREHFDEIARFAREASEHEDAWLGFCDLIWRAAEHNATDMAFCETIASTDKSAIIEEVGLLRMTGELIERAKAQGRIRADATADDVGIMMLGASAVMRLHPDGWRRHITLMLDGLRAS